ncbi:MAG: glycosyltransferase family 4 protein [Bacteroidota bacterium]
MQAETHTQPPKSRRVLAYGSVPHDTGTFTFYRNLRAGLAPLGWEVRCVSVGAQTHRAWDATFVDDGCVSLVPDEADRKRQAQAFVAWCQEQNVDAVMPINSVPILSALPHLPPEVRIVSRCANAFDHGYKITMSAHERLARIVATTPRHVRDLTERYGADPDQIVLIPHGIDPTPLHQALAHRQPTDVLRIAFLGRLEHNQKGVMFIPGIVRALAEQGVAFRLSIAGEGTHREEVEAAMDEQVAAGAVRFLGRLAPEDVPGYLAQHDAFLFPSRFEGFGFALIEAMMAGCVPVASHLEGITNFIIEDGVTGYLCEVGDQDAFAARFESLHRDRDNLASMQRETAQHATKRFSHTRMAQDYAAVLDAVVGEPTHGLAAKSWQAFQVDPAFAQTWRRHVPPSLKRIVRRTLFRLKLSDRY